MTVASPTALYSPPTTRGGMNEEAFMVLVTDYASWHGWQWAHIRSGRTVHGWRTPISGPLGEGFPDLILVKGERLLLVELKGDGGRLAEPQKRVIAVLERAVPVLVCWPYDWPRLKEILDE